MIFLLIVLLLAFFALIYLTFFAGYPDAAINDKHFKIWKKHFEKHNELTTMIFKFFEDPPQSGSLHCNKDYNKFIEILNIGPNRIKDDNFPHDTLRSAHQYEERNKKMIESFKHLIPELKQEEREKKLNEILK